MYERQTNIYEFIFPQFKIDKPIRLIELFAGIGAQAKALEVLGADFERYRVVEIDKYAMRSYNAVHGTLFICSDITQTHAEDLAIVDTEQYTYIMCYSFPCQDLSLAGKRTGMGKGACTRSGLLWEVERILDECTELPQVLLMENVPDVVGAKNIEDFYIWRNKLESLGYSNYVQILNAKDYGIPQNRKRCFMVSIQGDWNYQFPAPQKLLLRLKDMLEGEVNEKYYLKETSLKKLYRKGATDYKGPTKILVPAKNAKGYTEAEDGDGIYIDRPEQKRGVVQHNMIPTLKTGGNDVAFVESVREMRVRMLTPRECWRLMGFTDVDFDKAAAVVSNTRLYMQAGNSIVVNVLVAIFKQML